MSLTLTIITGADLRPGMIIFPVGVSPTEKNSQRVGAYSGKCDKGRHFGSGCFDTIGRWQTFVKDDAK